MLAARLERLVSLDRAAGDSSDGLCFLELAPSFQIFPLTNDIVKVVHGALPFFQLRALTFGKR